MIPLTPDLRVSPDAPDPEGALRARLWSEREAEMARRQAVRDLEDAHWRAMAEAARERRVEALKRGEPPPRRSRVDDHGNVVDDYRPLVGSPSAGYSMGSGHHYHSPSAMAMRPRTHDAQREREARMDCPPGYYSLGNGWWGAP